MLLDPEGRIRYWNNGAEFIFGIERGEALGRHFSVLFLPEDVEAGIPAHEIATAEAHGVAEDDRWLARPDGSRFWATGVVNAIRDDNNRLLGFGKVLRNRTDLREQVETLRNQIEASFDRGEHKEVFLSTVVHELRNPLAPLSNAVELVRRSAPANPELEIPLRIMERQIDNLRRLVDDLLDFTRIGAGKIDLRRQTVSLQDVVQRAVESTRPGVRQRHHRLEVLLPSSPMLVEADSDRLEQVFVNLITNAAKYTPEGGRIWIKGTTEGDEAVVHVDDNGVGIPRDMLPRIFELFTQVESSRSQSQGGLGIGLSLVKKLVTLHGGSVQVRSPGRGKGSQFTVRLPLTEHVTAASDRVS